MSMLGRSSAEKSTWPQGCGTYQAAVKSGAVDLAMLSGVAPLTSWFVVQVVAVPKPTVGQLVVSTGVPAMPASEASRPSGVAADASGVSAENDHEPQPP